MHTIFFMILFVVSLGVSQHTTRDRLTRLETKIEFVEKRQDKADHSLNEYYHEIYIKGNNRHKRHSEKLNNTNLQSIGTIIAGVLVVLWQLMNHRKINILQKNGGGGGK